MKLSGKIKIGTRIVREASVETDQAGQSFRDALEECLISLCKELNIPVPLWLKKNTTEFVSFRRTFFSREQFVEKVDFDRFEIRME